MVRTLLKITFSVCLLFISISAWSQEREYIAGILLDSKTQEPIAFASIRIKDRALGIISNTDGSFKIPVKYKEYGDIIEISSMGYQTKELFIYDFSIYELNMVRLHPATQELEEAIVFAKPRKNLSAKRIVKRAIENILTNYPTTAYSTVGYYRDYQLRGEEYVNLNEAILEVFDQGFKSIDSSTTRTRIYDYSQNQEFKRDTISDNPYDYKRGSKIIVNGYMSGLGGNEFSTLKVHDAIRNYQVNSFDFINSMKDGDIFKNHSFKRLQDVHLSDQHLYSIQINRNKYPYSAVGKLYIAKRNFAIHKLEYKVYDHTKKSKLDKAKSKDPKSDLKINIIIAYKEHMNGKMYLNYISFHNTFQLRLLPKFRLKYVEFWVDEPSSYQLRTDFRRKWFILTFSENLNADFNLDINNINIKFKGKQVPLDGLLVSNDQMMIYPKSNTPDQLKVLEEIVTVGRREGLTEKVLQVDVGFLMDVKGNLINQRNAKAYDQFREFFVQEVKLNPSGPKDNLLMHNRKPIFQDQPIVKPDNFDDYWMNTPLQNMKN